MKLVKPSIFSQLPHVHAAMSLLDKTAPESFSMAFGLGNTKANAENRQRLIKKLGFDINDIASPSQTHSDIVHVIENSKNYIRQDGDAIITNQTNRLIGVSVADCTPILLYDIKNQAVGAVHSGWRGTKANIVSKTVDKMNEIFNTQASDLWIWVGPGAGQCCYEVGQEFKDFFDSKYLKPINTNKFMFASSLVIADQLADLLIPNRQVEIDSNCTIHDNNYHSYRRDGNQSGRMLAVIGIKS